MFKLKAITIKYYEHFLFRFQRHVTIELLIGSVVNDVVYITAAKTPLPMARKSSIMFS